MPQYKGTVVLTAGPHGWTETYYLVLTTAGGAATNLMAIITARLALLESHIGVLAATISDVSKRGDSIVVLSSPELGTAVDATGYVVLDSAVLVKWQVGIYNRNKTFLRGIPNGQQSDGFTTFDVGFLADFATYFSVVIANAVFPVTVINPAPPPKYIVDHYSPATAGSPNNRLARRKSGRPLNLPRGRRVAP